MCWKRDKSSLNAEHWLVAACFFDKQKFNSWIIWVSLVAIPMYATQGKKSCLLWSSLLSINQSVNNQYFLFCQDNLKSRFFSFISPLYKNRYWYWNKFSNTDVFKGRMTPQKWMNFQRKSKQPPPPCVQKKFVLIFRKYASMYVNLQRFILDW